MPKYLVVGAGLSGAVIARRLAEEKDATVVVVDERNHIAGNCYCERDADTNVMIHHYGPHIFNTDSEIVWNYVNRFATFRPFVNRVKAITPKGVFSLPINLLTINTFFEKRFNPEEAKFFISQIGDKNIKEPKNFEEQALKLVGRKLYENFFEGYTIKQWGCSPKELSASILNRLPIRFNYDDNYYNTKYQGIPEEGYTDLISRILSHPSITVKINCKYNQGDEGKEYQHVFYSGPIDAYFKFQYGRLGYRTVNFERVEGIGDMLGNPVINYTQKEIPWTRVHEHKHFTPWEKHEKTVVFREYSKHTDENDTPYYPIRNQKDLEILKKYEERKSEERNVTFLGRLGQYRYLDMDDVIEDALLINV